MAQGEEAAIIIISFQRRTGQVQGFHKLLVMAFGIVPDHDAVIIDLLFH
ncbi:MAG: hypothetical protein ACYDHX_16345 [Methanothrix sp.]